MKTGCCNSKLIHLTDHNAICINSGCENYLGYTSYKNDYIKWRNPFAVAAITFFLLFSFEDFSKEKNVAYSSVLLLPAEKDILTITKVKEELHVQEVMCSKEVLSQVKIESANLTSSLFRKTNNMLGMRYAFKRKTTAAGIYIPSRDTIIYGSQDKLKKYRNTINYAVYANWKDGIADYKLWQDANFKVSERYLEFIGKTYAEDPSYVNKIRQVTSTSKD